MNSKRWDLTFVSASAVNAVSTRSADTDTETPWPAPSSSTVVDTFEANSSCRALGQNQTQDDNDSEQFGVHLKTRIQINEDFLTSSPCNTGSNYRWPEQINMDSSAEFKPFRYKQLPHLIEIAVATTFDEMLATSHYYVLNTFNDDRSCLHFYRKQDMLDVSYAGSLVFTGKTFYASLQVRDTIDTAILVHHQAGL